MSRQYDASLGATRLPMALLKRLDSTADQTRIPRAELVRFFITSGLDEYTTSRGRLRHDDLVTDLVEQRHEYGLRPHGDKSTEDHAAA